MLSGKTGKFQFYTASPWRQTRKLAHTRCRGDHRIVHCLNMLLRVQAPDEQYLTTVQHGSLLRAKFQSYGQIKSVEGLNWVVIRFVFYFFGI